MVKDPITGGLSWRPTLKQERFLSLPLTIKEGFYAGAVGAGKSDVLLMYPIVHGWYKHPMFKGLFLRRTMPELRREIIPRAKEYFRHFKATYNAQDGLFTFPSGALFFMGHCEHEDDVHNYDSMQPNYVAFDELTSFTEWIYTYIVIQRIRVDEQYKNILPMIARSASNPGNVGHQFVYKRFIKPYPEGGKLIIGRGGIKRIFIPATIDDNPYLPEQYKKELDSLPEAERRAKKYGDWNAYEGAVFDEFRERRYPDEPKEALHVIAPIHIPEWWPRIVSIDWGYAPPAMTWMGFGAISPSKKLYIYRELYWQKTLIETWCAEAKIYIDKENIKLIRLCQSAAQDQGREHTIHEQIIEGLGRDVELTKNTRGSRISGKMLMHEYFRWLPKFTPESELPKYSQEYYEWLMRNRTEGDVNTYLKSLKPPEPEYNLPKLQIFKNCEQLISAIKTCFYDKTHTQDVAEFPGDDPYDGCRYLVDAADNYFVESSLEFERVKRQEEIERMLKNTQDWTAFYRNSRKLDAEIGRPKAVSRFHKAMRTQ